MTTNAPKGAADATPGAGERPGIGWTDSSWELRRGLEVVEDLPLALWPGEPIPAEPQRRNVPSSPM